MRQTKAFAEKEADKYALEMLNKGMHVKKREHVKCIDIESTLFPTRQIDIRSFLFYAPPEKNAYIRAWDSDPSKDVVTRYSGKISSDGVRIYATNCTGYTHWIELVEKDENQEH